MTSESFERAQNDESFEPESRDDNLDEPLEIESEELADWGGSDLEAAYLKAMMALEASDAELPDEVPIPSTSPHDFDEPKNSESSVSSPVDSPKVDSLEAKRTLTIDAHDPIFSETIPDSMPSESLPSETTAGPPVEDRLTPRQILEACLFVGGSALTSKKLAGILRGDFDSEFVDREIDELNRLYAAECRPYEIRLGEGGYRLTLREEFERIRHKVYGLGPKEVRLSQDALEVLAVVAYHQPVNQARVEALGKPSCGAVLRQLVRRELLAVHRDPEHPRDVQYKTTPRFLSLFGIRNLDELPRHEQVSYK